MNSIGSHSSSEDSSCSSKKSKVECSYGERCYRKKPEHFQEFTHSHLNELLKGMGDKKIEVPSNYKPKISKQTLVEQLEMVRNFCSIAKVPDTTFKKSPSKDSSRKITTNSPVKETPVSTRPDQVSRKHSPSPSLSQEKSPPKPNKTTNGDGKEEPKNERWDQQMVLYKKDAFKRIKVSMKEKMEAAAPYNVFLTTIKDSPETHKEPLSISFPELLDPYFGELDSSLQINFMIEFGFLLAQYSITGYKSRPLTLLYGQCDCDLGDKFKHFLTHAKVIPPSNFGSHHTKMMVFRYTNKSVRIVVSTSNLVESDWENRTQGLWISPECPALPPDSDTGAGESVTNFKRDFLAYLTAYRLPCLQPWLETLRQVDMSAIKVFFVASVPGSHTTYRNDWGQLKLAKLLKENIVPNDGDVIAQCSSIGSLGPKPTAWLQGEVLTTLTQTKNRGLSSPSHLKLIYPSFNCISNSYDGLLGGGCLPYSKNTHKKQEWLIAFLCDWFSEKRHRTRAPPHIKTYCRVSKDLRRMYYFVLTSANMSKAAWGQQAKSGSLNILSYEAGILLVPQLLVSKDYFPLAEEEEGAKVFSLPYDLPVIPYNYSDVPWFIDNLSL